MSEEILQALSESLVELEEDRVAELTAQALADGVAPQAIIQQGLAPGMAEVGQRFEDGDYYLPELLIAAEAFKAAVELVKPHLGEAIQTKGTVVLGTVEGDIHREAERPVGGAVHVGEEPALPAVLEFAPAGFPVAGQQAQQREVSVGIGVVRPQLQGPAVANQRLVQLSLLLQRRAQVAVSFSKRRLQLQGPAVAEDRGFQLALRLQGSAQVAVGLD